MKKPKVRLTGVNGNVFNIIAICAKALKKSENPALENEFTDKAFAASSYDKVLRLAQEYCEVS
jgi:hypothetical protein